MITTGDNDDNWWQRYPATFPCCSPYCPPSSGERTQEARDPGSLGQPPPVTMMMTMMMTMIRTMMRTRQVLRLTQKASGSGKLTRWGPWRWPWWWPWPWPLWWVWSKASECSRLWWCGFEGTEESPRLKILRWTDLLDCCAMRGRRWPILVTWCHLWMKEQLNRKTLYYVSAK